MTANPDRLVVLLADDSEDDVILIRRRLNNPSRVTKLIAVPNGEEAIDCPLGNGNYADRETHPFPDALILDHRMARLSGLRVLCWLRDEPRFVSLPVLIFSQPLRPAEVEAVTRLRAACCVKPLIGTETRLVVEHAIAESLRLVDLSPSAGANSESSLRFGSPSPPFPPLPPQIHLPLRTGLDGPCGFRPRPTSLSYPDHEWKTS